MGDIKNVYIGSAHLRCKPNAVLTSSIARFVKANGHNIVKDLSASDYILLNTCGFTADQEKVCVDFFKEAKATAGADSRLISMGCMNKIGGNSYAASGLSDVVVLDTDNQIDNYLYRTKKYDEVEGEFVDDALMDELGMEIYPTGSFYSSGIKKIVRYIEKLRGTDTTIGLLFKTVDQHNKIYIEVAKGCVGNCAYCIIKKAKGHVKSRPKEDILADIQKLYSPDKTIYLVGDDCASYGVDNKSSISKLILYIHEFLPEASFNINYVSPFWLEKQKDEFINLFKQVKIASINVTLQSGSDRIIKKMNRTYRPSNVGRIIDRLREISPKTVFLTHMLLGFPGETTGDFIKSLRISNHFDATAVFAYCDREGTKSDKMTDKKSQFTVKSRAAITNMVAGTNVVIKTMKDLIVGR